MQNKKFVSTPLDAYIVPTADAHNSEYVADCDKRRQYISGFTGSAGTAVVTASKAALWTDGRYHTQVLFYFCYFLNSSDNALPIFNIIIFYFRSDLSTRLNTFQMRYNITV